MDGARLGAWHDFFAAVAGVTATLVGLLFVALALNPAQLGARGSAGLQTWAGQSFHSFLVVLTIALVALVPDGAETTLAITLIVISGLSLVHSVRGVARVRSDPAPEWHGRAVVARFVSPIVAHLLAVWVGWRLLVGDVEAVGWLVAVVFFLMMSAASSCWDLLREVGEQADR